LIFLYLIFTIHYSFSFQVKVDRKKVRFPKLKFKGAFHPTVIRKTPDEKKGKEEDAKANVEATAGVNFTNVLQAALTRKESKSVKIKSSRQYLRFWDLRV
jgi:hypothetical protein